MGRLTHERLNGIQNGYWSPNKKQELVDRLAAYENTDLDPEQVEHVKKTAKKYLLEKAEGKVNGWIPVDERLPENGDEVLVQWEFYSRCDNMTYTYIHIMRLNKMTGEWNGTYGVPNGNVIAWRPLPEPYRMDQERSVE